MTTLETQLYHIHYRAGKRTGKFNGEFDEVHKDTWLTHLNRREKFADIEYWAEPIVMPEEDKRALETAKRLAGSGMMITEQEREALVKAANDGRYSGNMGCKLNGFCCSVGGWKNHYATISPCSGGIYHADWETVKRVVEGDRQFKNLFIVGSGWLGSGCGPNWKRCEKAGE